MQWMKTKFDFGLPMALLTVSFRDLVFHSIKDMMQTAESPESIERLMVGLICDHRPDLTGGSLVCMNFDLSNRRWEFLYSHPSLPKVAAYGIAESQPLIRNADEPHVVGSE